MSDEVALAGLLGRGATYRGDLVFQGRVRVDGHFIGTIRSDDLLEVVAGRLDGTLRARERCTLLESAVVRGRVESPWLDVRLGCRLDAEVLVHRSED